LGFQFCLWSLVDSLEELNLSCKGKNLPLFLGGSRPFVNKSLSLVLDEGVSHEVVRIDFLPFFVGIVLAGNEIKELDIVCHLVSFEEVNKQITGRFSPHQKVLDLSLDILIDVLMFESSSIIFVSNRVREVQMCEMVAQE
jgi:hypothetical protein